MSTTDTRAAFEAWAAKEHPEANHIIRDDGKYKHGGMRDWWPCWKAATEAAKANGTAGEFPPLPEGKLYDTPAGPMHRYTINQMREYGGKCADAARNLAIEQAEVARQPAPAVSSDLRNAAQLIMDLYDDMRMGKQAIPAFDALRAALAATAPVLSERDMAIAQAVRQACVNSYSPDDSASDYTEKMGDIDLATVIRAATNRSQP